MKHITTVSSTVGWAWGKKYSTYTKNILVSCYLFTIETTTFVMFLLYVVLFIQLWNKITTIIHLRRSSSPGIEICFFYQPVVSLMINSLTTSGKPWIFFSASNKKMPSRFTIFKWIFRWKNLKQILPQGFFCFDWHTHLEHTTSLALDHPHCSPVKCQSSSTSRGHVSCYITYIHVFSMFFPPLLM